MTDIIKIIKKDQDKLYKIIDLWERGNWQTDRPKSQKELLDKIRNLTSLAERVLEISGKIKINVQTPDDLRVEIVKSKMNNTEFGKIIGYTANTISAMCNSAALTKHQIAIINYWLEYYYNKSKK